MKKNSVHGTPEQFEAALKNKIQELGGSIQDDVTSAVEIDDEFNKVPNVEDYANDLGQKVVSLLSEQGFTGTFTVDGGYLSFEIDGEPDSIYVQSLNEIDPVWNDLDSDAATLADEVINQFYE